MSFIKIETHKLPLDDKQESLSLNLSKRLTKIMYLHTMEVFDQEGPGWAPLKASTKKQRLKQGFGEGPILDRKRARLGLRGGIIEAPTNTEAVVGVRAGELDDYAKIHQFGGRIIRVTKPGTVRLRTDRKGKLLRQEKKPNLTIFASKKHKLVKEIKKSFGKRFTILIPKRSYIKITRELLDKCKAVAIDFLNGK